MTNDSPRHKSVCDPSTLALAALQRLRGDAAREINAMIAAIEAERIAHPDADLLALREELDKATDIETKAYDVANAVSDRPGSTDDEQLLSENIAHQCAAATSAIVKQIAAMPAKTLDGLALKARALRWCWQGEETNGEPEENLTTDLRVVRSIVADLCRIPDAPDTAKHDGAGRS